MIIDANIVKKLDRDAVKLICVSGYFDPIHIGHIEYLTNAKLWGSKFGWSDKQLIVIVNNSRQAFLKKNFEFMKCAERLKIVNALRVVDWVIESIDEDGTVCKTLELIKPDIFAKSGDRHIDDVPETPICKRLGIAMVDVPGEKIQSSSDLVKRSK